jgi:peroxiredoxin
MHSPFYSRLTALSVCCLLAAASPVFGQYKAADILKQYRPSQPDVEYDTPEADEFENCRVDVEHGEGTAGFVVYGPAGQVLRRFTDINGDSKPDLFRYYRMGLEVYRAIDTNKDQKADEHRWMNWGGMRWGVDRDQDGRIDSWKALSAQEAAQIAVESMIRGDLQRLATVLVTAEDLQSIRATPEVTRNILQNVADPATQVRKALSSRTLTSRSKWVRFDPPVPGMVPKEDGKAAVDLLVYENAMGIVENGDTHELVSIGEMIRVGNVWKLAQIPMPLDSENAQVQLGGVMMQPALASDNVAAGSTMSKEMEELLSQLEKVDNASPTTNVTPEALARYNRQRADLIEKIIRLIPTEREKAQWIQQFADGVAAAVQSGQYNEGLQRLTALQEQVKANEELLAYVWYRRLLAEYAVRLKPGDEKAQQQGQEWWLKELEAYSQRWPQAPDTVDAIAQLAVSLELSGRIDDAKRWYGVLASKHAQTSAGVRARGALHRLDLAGKPLQLAGTTITGQQIDISQYRGKVTLVVFWATWARPYTEDLPKLVAAHQKYQRSGFEILGVNLDSESTAGSIRQYLAQHGGNWHHLRDPKGTEGKLAAAFGIVSVPTMFIVDKAGRVAGPVTAENLDTAVAALLNGQPLTNGNQQGAAAAPRQQN